MADRPGLKHVFSRRRRQPQGSVALAQQRVERGQVDELEIARTVGLDRNGRRRRRRHVAAPVGAEVGPVAFCLQARLRGVLDLPERVIHAAELAQQVDPAQDRDDDENDGDDGQGRDHHGRAVAVEPRVEHHQRGQREQEPADEGGEHRLRGPVAHQHAIGPRRGFAGGGLERADHHAQRERRHREERRREDLEDGQHRFGAEPVLQLLRYDPFEVGREQGGDDRETRHQDDPDAQPPGKAQRQPQDFRQHQTRTLQPRERSARST